MIALSIIVILYIICSLILLGYGLQCYIMTFLYLRKRKERLAVQHQVMNYYYSISDENQYPKVVTQLPMYNEKAVACRVIEAAAAMDYPRSRHEIQVLDDSNDETIGYVDATVEKLRKQGINVNVIRRTDRTGFKAGALQNGLNFTDAEFVAIFDADFVPNPDFLKKSIAFFVGKPNLGLVQGRWTHLNQKASLITRGQAMGIDGHFMIEQAARSWNGLFMNFNGTAGVFRRKAIETSGGWQHDTLTEDMDLSYRMQIADWDTEYVPDLEVPAEIPEDINAFKNQQFRWAKGSIQTARKIIPLLMKKDMSKFKLIQAVFHLTHYMVHPMMLLLALLTMPILYYVKAYLPLPMFIIVICCMIAASSGPSFMYMISQYYLKRNVFRQMLMIPPLMLIGTGLAVNNAKAVFEAIFKFESPFHRTPKKGEARAKSTYRPIKDITAVIELLVGFYCLISFQMFIGFSSILVSPFLVMYTAGFLFVGILSIVHFRKPELVDLKLQSLIKPSR